MVGSKQRRWVLCLLVMLGILVGTAFAARAAIMPVLRINDLIIPSGNYHGFSYDAEAHTLTLKDANFLYDSVVTDAPVIVYSGTGTETLHIILNGGTTVRRTSGTLGLRRCSAISIVSANAVISGNGFLEAYGHGLNGIACTGDLTIESGGVLADGGDSVLLNTSGIYCEGDLTVTGGKVVAFGGTSVDGDSSGIRCEQAVTISGGAVTAYGEETLDMITKGSSSFGINAANTTIGAKATSVLARGYTGSINGPVRNEMDGSAWESIDASSEPLLLPAGQYSGLTCIYALYPVPIPVTGLELDKTSLTLQAGSEGSLSVTVFPSDATHQTVRWSSDNEAAATVDMNGTVTGVAEGTAVITATTINNGCTAACSVTVTGTSSGSTPKTDPDPKDVLPDGKGGSGKEPGSNTPGITDPTNDTPGGSGSGNNNSGSGSNTSDSKNEDPTHGKRGSSSGSGSNSGNGTNSNSSGSNGTDPTPAASGNGTGPDAPAAGQSTAQVPGADQSAAQAASAGQSAPQVPAAGSADTFVRIKSVKHTGRKLAVTWDAVAGAEGYDVYAASYFGGDYLSVPVKTVAAAGIVLRKVQGRNGLTKVTKDTIRYVVRAFRTVNGQKQYIANSFCNHTVGKKHGKYSDVKKIVIGKSGFRLKVGDIQKLEVKVKTWDGRKQPGKIKTVRYYSSDVNVAIVSRNGKIKAVGAGVCKIFVAAENGLTRVVHIAVG